MQMLINFIQTYWRVILDVCSVIVCLILWLVKKKPVKVVDTLKEIIVRVLPSLICLAEKTGLKGSDKMRWLLNELTKVLKEFDFGDDVISQYLPFATEQVELILSTPQKKGF